MIKTILSKIAPTLASALLGPFGGVAKNFMAKKLGLDELPSGGKLDKFLDSFLVLLCHANFPQEGGSSP